MSDPIGDAARDPGGGPSTVDRGDAAGTDEALAAADRSSSDGLAQGVVCPLLELVGGRGASGPAIEDAGNRCAASSPPAPVSNRQQRFVCLDAGHVDCPRFVRATASPRAGGGRPVRAVAVAAEAAVIAGTTPGMVSTASDPRSASTSTGSPATGSPANSAAASSASPDESPIPASPTAASAAPVAPVTPVTRSSRRSGARRAGSRPTPTIVAGGILAVALVLTVAFVSIRGGLALPAASPSAAGLASPSPAASAPESAAPSPSPTATPPPSPSPSPTPSPVPTPTVSPTPVPTPSPSLPAAYQGLKPCPDAPACYLYRVRSGDNLTSIAGKFGITVTALRKANREIADPSLLHVGDRIRVPLPPS